MKIHVITIGQPKLAYAKSGWEEYWHRLSHYHQLHATHIADKHDDAKHILEAIGTSYAIILSIDGKQLSSNALATTLDGWTQQAKELSFVIGGPLGLPPTVINRAQYHWSLSDLTFPHDLAMVIVLESLYRASTITQGQPYHK